MRTVVGAEEIPSLLFGFPAPTTGKSGKLALAGYSAQLLGTNNINI
jgi:hypothetical protein